MLSKFFVFQRNTKSLQKITLHQIGHLAKKNLAAKCLKVTTKNFSSAIFIAAMLPQNVLWLKVLAGFLKSCG